MKKYLVLLDFDGTLVERNAHSFSDKIPFHELETLKQRYLELHHISIHFHVITSSCAKSIERIMTMSELCTIDQWNFENGLHIRRYNDFSEELITNQATESFQKLRAELSQSIQEIAESHGIDIDTVSEKKCSIAIHCNNNRDKLYLALESRFGAKIDCIKSAHYTVELFPKSCNKKEILNRFSVKDYHLIMFLGDSIYPQGNDYEIALHSAVDISIEVKNCKDSAKLLQNMKEHAHIHPLSSEILNRTQARIVKDKKSSLRFLGQDFYSGKKHILLDFDGTLTFEEGRLFPGIIEVLRELQHDYKIWIVTGRSKGWADMMIHTLPIDGVIGENGAFAFYWEAKQIKQWLSPHLDPSAEQKLLQLKSELLAQFPWITLASDQFSRQFDIAAVSNEHGHQLSKEQIDAIHIWAHRHQAQAVISNIHINIWFGLYNKAQSVIDLFSEIYGIQTLALCRSSFYIGDSPNDEPMFRLIDASFGVQNVELFAHKLRYRPSFTSVLPEGAGALDILRKILLRQNFLVKSAS